MLAKHPVRASKIDAARPWLWNARDHADADQSLTVCHEVFTCAPVPLSAAVKLYPQIQGGVADLIASLIDPVGMTFHRASPLCRCLCPKRFGRGRLFGPSTTLMMSAIP